MFIARLLTTLVGVPIILALVWLGGWPFALAAAVIAALAAEEAARALGGARDGRRLSSLLPAVGAFILTVLGALGTKAVLAGTAVLLLIAVILALFSIPTAIWTAQCAGLFYVGLPLALLVVLRVGQPASIVETVAGVRLTSGATWTFLLLTSVWAVDVGAYLVGRLIGRHKLWPRVSPKKTREGTVAGVLAGALVWIAWGPIVGLSPALAGVLGLLMACTAVIGDLAESAIKREAGLKDASTLLPGHGGLLDRLDSLGFATVIVFLYGMLLGA